MEAGISIVIPTCNGGHVFSDCLEMIGRQRYSGAVQLIVVDSGSTDGTIRAAKRARALIKRINQSEFHHARTRNMAVSLAAFQRVIFMVQDAVPCSNDWLLGMARGLEEDGVAAAFAAQVPHVDAPPYARFETDSVATARLEASAWKGIESWESLQRMPYDRVYRTVGLDNVCAVYRKELLERVPFPDVNFAEDLGWGLKMSLLGRRILYLPHVQVRHSHHRSPDYAFRRQIVNSYWVARVMGRVREDFSHLSLRDLVSVTGAVRFSLFFMMKERRFGLSRPKGKALFVDRLLKRYPLIDRIRMGASLPLFSGYAGGPSPRGKEMAQQAETDMACHLELIEKGYPPQDGQEWLETLEQVAANILGRMHGEVYAASMLKGPVPYRLESFMRPFLSGV